MRYTIVFILLFSIFVLLFISSGSSHYCIFDEGILNEKFVIFLQSGFQLNQTHIQSVLLGTNGVYRTEEFVGSQITYCLKFFVKKSGENFSHSLLEKITISDTKVKLFSIFLNFYYIDITAIIEIF